MQKSFYYFLFVFALFIGICAPSLFSDGMFMDGLLYANIAKNMAHGMGSFWRPFLTDTFFPVFYEHPPLAFGLQSIFFRILGNSILTERLYSLFSYILCAWLMILIWKELGGKTHTAWTALLYWIIIPIVTWACANNMLENTLSVFVCASVFFFVRSVNTGHHRYVFFSGLCLAAAFLTKGFVAFFPWSLPFWYFLFMRKSFSAMHMLISSMIFVFSTIGSLVVLFILCPAAFSNITNYLQTQVINSLQNTVTVDNRFFIVRRLLSEILPSLFLMGLIIVYAKKNIPFCITSIRRPQLYVFFCLALSGVLPIMISLKQNGFYILPSLPFFAIAMALVTEKAAEHYMAGPAISYFNKIKILSLGLAIAAVMFSLMQIQRIGRDKTKIRDMYKILAIVPQKTIVGVCPEMYLEWSLHGYYHRYGMVSLDSTSKKRYEYFIAPDNCNADSLNKYYVPVDAGTERYMLFRLRDDIQINPN